MVDSLLNIVNWLLENKVVGLPVAIAAAAGIAASSVLLRRRQRRRSDVRNQTSHSAAKLLQQNVEHTKARGDVNINARQD